MKNPNPEINTTSKFLKLFDEFISESHSGIRLQKNGKMVGKGTIRNYENLKKLISDFSKEKSFNLKIPLLNHDTKKYQLQNKKEYWKEFYQRFSDFIYCERNGYDNYVGTVIKTLKTFFRYLKEEKDFLLGDLYSHCFIAMREEIPIIVLYPEQLHFLIHNKKFEARLNSRLKIIKDVFVFGCTVGLRVSDLLTLKPDNLKFLNGNWFLQVKSKKTNTLTTIKLPEYAVRIVKRYENKYFTLLPKLNKVNLNESIKELATYFPWNHEVKKFRCKKGLPFEIFKDDLKTPFMLSDLYSTHTMRRTAISTMLTLGMHEQAVRKISGHAPQSKEFYRYVNLSQSFINKEIDMVFEKLSSKKLEKY